MARKSPYKSVLRAFDILELVGSSINGLRLNELVARLVAVNPGSLHTMLHALVERGYLVKLQLPVRYILGPALETINCHSAFDELHRRISPVMIAICKQSRMRITYQRFVAGNGVVLFGVHPETYFYVYTSDYVNKSYGTSVIFQAYMTPEEQDEFWAAHPMDDVEKKIWGSFKNLRRYLKIAAKQRLAVIAPQHGQPFRVTGPIFDSSGKVPAAISAIQIESKLTLQQANAAAQLIHRAAVELSAHESPEISANRTTTYSAHGQRDCRQTGSRGR